MYLGLIKQDPDLKTDGRSILIHFSRGGLAIEDLFGACNFCSFKIVE